MIFDELILHNYGVYPGRQSLQLAAAGARRRPITLIGGLNGAGKTSLLDAIQLALYGQSAALSGRRGLAYDKLLRRLINRSVDPAEGASVELAFRVYAQGALQRYRVRRTWCTSESGYTRETVDVFLDGQHDRVLTERWQEQVEAFVPRGIAPLFFFDAEQIEAFTNPETAKTLLRTSLQSLLGLDLVERLRDDLSVLQRRRVIRGADDSVSGPLRQLEREVASLKDAASKAQEDLASARALLLNAERACDEAATRFREAGGELYERTRELESRHRTLKERMDRLAGELREIAEGPSCFLLVAHQLPDIIERANHELEVLHNEQLVDLLADRDGEILADLRSRKITGAALEVIDKALRADRSRRQGLISNEVLGLGERAAEALVQTLTGFVEDQHLQLAGRLLEIEQLSEELTTIERQLESVPAEDAIATLRGEKDEAERSAERARGMVDAAVQRDGEAARALEERERALRRFVEMAADGALRTEDAERLQTHSNRVSATLADFRRQVTLRHLSRIEAAVLESLQQLLHKTRLVSALRIAPESFGLELSGENGKPIGTDELSAGERQLLAIATLWGLARASGRPLPVVIDTPLGRLDAKHRSHLVKRYFPYASHQVVLLSTDDEIDAPACAELSPFIGRKYHLRFDDAISGTRVQEGYFC